YGNLVLDALNLKVEGDARSLSFSGDLEGTALEAVKLETEGAASRSGGAVEITLRRLEGGYGPLPLSLAGPLRIRMAPGGWMLEPATLRAGTGSIKASGRFFEPRVSLSLGFEGLPVSAVRTARMPGITGTAEGDIRIEGPPVAPRVLVALRLEDFRIEEPRLKALAPASLEARLRLEDGRCQGEAVLQGLTQRPFEGRLEAPVILSLKPLSLSFPPEGTLTGALQGEADLSRLVALAGLADQVLEGKAEVQLRVGGSPAAPVIEGRLTVKGGTYENLRIGTVLKDLEILLAARGPRLVLEKFRARDGAGGALSGQGWLDLSPGQGFPLRIEMDMDGAALLRHDNATATMKGRLTLVGSIREATLGGECRIENAEFRIPDYLPPEMTGIEVVEIPQRTGRKEAAGERETGRGPPVGLNLSLSAPGRVFVRGRGLESEWKGDLHLGGTLAAPVIRGAFSVVRGRFSFMDRRFTLTKGTITMAGETPPVPRVHLEAEADAADMTARLTLSGPLESPDIHLGSVPEYPRDEILSRLLFGRTLAGISPVQALQLAQAVNILSGGRGFDLMGRPRKWLGVDQLEVRQSEDVGGGATVSAGKYLSEKVYLEVERGLGPESGKASVEWEVTPNITVDTEAGANAQGGVGVRWEWDY
ncbi:MAG: translocation/assembly module TamB domain-containing protein, partial [Deltaproteobacteria bacterium]|nr:translocation/assembly module TamB domain-containing protein [Deltaproteobacteria bacterium]